MGLNVLFIGYQSQLLYNCKVAILPVAIKMIFPLISSRFSPTSTNDLGRFYFLTETRIEEIMQLSRMKLANSNS